MSDHPDAQDLLLVARDELMQNLLPQLPGALRYQALMIANAMAIAARECELGQSTSAHELAGLQDLLGQDNGSSPDENAAKQALQGLRKQLAEAIRQGRFDRPDEQQSALMQHLAATAQRKVAISNPKLLSPKAAA